MQKLIIIILCCILTSSAVAQPVKDRKLKRKDCFFGMHYDIHAKIDFENVGKTLTEDMVEDMLQRIKPDYIQVDTKGHAGITSYPSKYGTQVKSYEKDPLKLFRKVTERNNIALFSHYSGVLDDDAIKIDPNWAALDHMGKPYDRTTSYYSPYLEKKMIPQLKELALDYKIDGVWVDGDCWALRVDYNDACKKAFNKETGLQAPNFPGDKNQAEYVEFNRTVFKRYINTYTTEVKKVAPDFQVASNWAYSSKMPEPIDLPVDFLSGDVAAKNTVYSAAFESRCLAPQGKAWDLMSWSFTKGVENGLTQNCQKSATHLKQEVAQIIAMGGGVSMYFKQNKDMSIQPWTVDLASEIAKFCRERQELCHKSNPIPQIALVYSTAAFKERANKKDEVYRNGQWCKECGESGISELLLDAALPFEIKSEYHLSGKLDEYPVVVIPEWEYLPERFINELKQYVWKGGNLLVIGAKSVKLFKDELGVNFTGELKPLTNQHIGLNNKMTNIQANYQPFEPTGKTEVPVQTYSTNDFRMPLGNAVSINSYGKGKIAGIFLDLGAFYRIGRSPVYVDLAKMVFHELFQKPLVQLETDAFVNITLMEKNGKTMINLINAGGEFRNTAICTYNNLPPLYKLILQTNFKKKLKSAKLFPENIELEIDDRKIFVPELKVHSVIVLDFN